MLLVRGEFSFLYVDIWFEVTECKFITKNSSFEMLVLFSPMFVADTKVPFVYNFVAPLMEYKYMVHIKLLHNNSNFLFFLLNINARHLTLQYVPHPKQTFESKYFLFE